MVGEAPHTSDDNADLIHGGWGEVDPEVKTVLGLK